MFSSLFSILVFVAMLSVLIFVHELGHFVLAKRVGVRVDIFSIGLGPRLFRLFKKKDTEYIISLIPLGGYVKLAGDSWEEYQGKSDEYLARPLFDRLKILLGGVGFNYIFAFLCLWFVFYLGYPVLTTKVGEVLKDMPAFSAGIKEEDKVLAVNNQQVDSWERMQKIIQETTQDNVLLILERNGQKISLSVSLRRQEIKTLFGEKKSVSLIGVVPAGEFIFVKHGFIESFFLSWAKLFELSMLTLKVVWRLLLLRISLKEVGTGPLGMFFITKGAASIGFTALLNTLALISLSLSIFNVLPIPVLDGGHIVLLLVEKIKGRDFVRSFEKGWTKVGLGFLIPLILIIFYNDFIRFGVFEKISKFLTR